MTPFHIDIPQAVLDRIQARLAATRIGYMPDDDDQRKYGADANYLADFIDYWRHDYDWRAEEEKLNRWPQYLAGIDGIAIHFYHIQGRTDRSIPVLLTHGWPGSVVEFLAAIPLLVEAGFSLVIPSLPGFGWSGRPARPIGPAKIADMWRTLMIDELGYSEFFAQGGDWGSAVTVQLALRHTDVVRAIHLNMFMTVLPGSDADPALLAYWQSVGAMRARESAYQMEQETKPQTIGLALHDNPVGFAAWVLEKFRDWGDTAGAIEPRFSKDQLITNLMSYLATDSVISAIWLYYGRAQETPAQLPVTVPTGLACYPAEFYPLPNRELAQRAYNVAYWSEMTAGGHFAAMEEPRAFAQDLINFFGKLT